MSGGLIDVLSPHVKDPRLSSRHSVMRDHQPFPLDELLSCERTLVCLHGWFGHQAPKQYLGALNFTNQFTVNQTPIP